MTSSLQYLPLPWLLPAHDGKESEFLLHPITDAEYLLVDNERTRFRTMAAEEFTRDCKTVSGVLVCDGSRILDKRLQQTCLAALFLSHHEVTQTVCKVHVKDRKDTLVQYGPHAFFLYHADRQEIVRHCPNDADESAMFKGAVLLEAKAGCSFSTRSFVFDGRLEATTWAEAVVTKEVDLKALFALPGLNDTGIDNVIKELALVGNTDGLTIRDLSNKFVHVTTLGSIWTAVKWGLLIVMVVVGVVVFFQFCGGAGMISRCLKRRRRRKEEEDLRNERELDLEANLSPPPPKTHPHLPHYESVHLEPLDPQARRIYDHSMQATAADFARHQQLLREQFSNLASYPRALQHLSDTNTALVASHRNLLPQ